MSDQPFNVLFLCTGNSARSILAESIMTSLGKGRFQGFSAGSHPSGKVNPFAIELLEKRHFPVEGVRSKNWDEFAAPGSPQMDFIFTVCDNAAGEVCPIWPGQPMSAHWGVADPAAVEGTDDVKRKAFADTFLILHRRISLFLSLPLDKISRLALKREVDEIGRSGPAPGAPS